MSKLSQPNPGLTEARPFASMSRVHPQATVATAHLIARVYYRMLKGQG